MKIGLRSKVIGALCLVALVSGAALAPVRPVADAAQRGDLATLKTLLEQGADVNEAQGDGMTGLHWAAVRGDAQMITLLIGAGANVRAVTRIGSYTPLHLASKAGSGPIVRALLAAGGDANARTATSGTTPLHLAAAAGDPDAVIALLDRGAEVNAREASEWGQTPLMFAAATNRAAVIRELVKRGADAALTTKVIDVPERMLVDLEADKRLKETIVSYREAAGSPPGWQPTATQLQEAIEAARQVQSSGASVQPAQVAPFLTLVGTWGGLTALLHAAREGHAEAALALVDTGADVNQGSASDGTTPLLMATLNGHFDLALQLVERGADVNQTARSGAAPLFSVIQTQWAPKSQYPQPRAQDHQKVTYLETMEALLKAGADPNARLKTHIWYMEYARNRLNVDLVGATPFWRAAFAQDVPALRLLVAHGADPNVPTTVMRARRGGGDGQAQADPSGLPPVQVGGLAEHPIHAASGLGYLGIGAYRHRHAPDGWVSTMQYLVGELGMDVNVRDAEGYTALHYAASRGDKAQITYLLEHGADPNLVSRGGRSTADMARGGAVGLFEHVAYPDVVALLEAAGSK